MVQDYFEAIGAPAVSEHCAARELHRLTTEGNYATAEIGGVIGELSQWLLSLDAYFAFLLALPFVVGFAGLLSEHLRRRRARAISRGPKINHGSS